MGVILWIFMAVVNLSWHDCVGHCPVYEVYLFWMTLHEFSHLLSSLIGLIPRPPGCWSIFSEGLRVDSSWWWRKERNKKNKLSVEWQPLVWNSLYLNEETKLVGTWRSTWFKSWPRFLMFFLGLSLTSI